MIKHFENLWEEAEIVSESFYDNNEKLPYIDIIKAVCALQLSKSSEEKEEILGNILLASSFISKVLNINAYAALRFAIDNAKIEVMDDIIE
ncbi:MAG: hypothetical protein Q8P20_00385 [bacterium]|nr:hypothetical protein [bacterium]